MSLGDRIWSYIRDDDDNGNRPVDRLRRYYTTKPGRNFDTLCGGGARPETQDRFVADDVVAVALLSVDIPPAAIVTLLDEKRELLSGFLQAHVGEQSDTRALPLDQDLWDVDKSLIKPGSQADKLWHELDAIEGIGWVTTGKLMARKRPRLIPGFDRVIRACLMPKKSNTWWVSLHDAVDQDRGIVTRLEELKADAELPDEVSLLRVLDVAVWMTSQPPPSR
jgi:hypothetical protein